MFKQKNRTQSYVGVYYDSNHDVVIVWERDSKGNRVVVPYKAPYYFYTPSEQGEYTTIFGDKVTRVDFDSYKEYDDGLKRHRVRFESDFTPVQRVLMDEYYGAVIPNINYALFDIEVDYSAAAGGFADPTTNPYAPINANTVYQSWTDKFITTAVLPKGLKKTFNRKKFDKYVSAIAKTHNLFAVPDVEIMADEVQLLERFVEDIDNSDMLSGWNSEYFDIPYVIKRMEKVCPKLVKRMCFTGCKPPREKIVEVYGSPRATYQLNGRSHLDYKDMFKKFTFEGRVSYSLASITGDELDAPKMEHEGTLEQLYNGTFIPQVSTNWNNVDVERTDVLENLTMRRAILLAEINARNNGEFFDRDLSDKSTREVQALLDEITDDVRHCSFATFCCYNAHDVGCLLGLEKKFKFIQLVNQMAHENTCEFKDLLGTVRYVETGIANRAHYVHKKVVMDKRVMTDGEKVEGALVLTPYAGLHKWLGSVDITSLYPSVIRSLCISPERFVGQFSDGEKAWRGIKDMSDDMFTLCDDAGESVTMSGSEWWQCLVENGWAISGYGTVFDQSQGPGVIDETLSFWFAERKRLNKIKEEWKKKRNDVGENFTIQLTDEEYAIFKTGKGFEDIRKRVKSGELFQHDKSFYTLEVHEQIVECEKQVNQFDLLQLTKKIQLNSCYGALLSPYFRFGRKEMGASVTATGRQITTFMMENIAEIISGTPIKIVKKSCVEKDGRITNEYFGDNSVIIYGDTDSCYFLTGANNKEDAIRIADATGVEINSRFPEFMSRAFNCQGEHANMIKASREIVGSAGLFLPAKKKYTIKVVNLDGFDLPIPKLKTMGSEMKKADTPKIIQEFLKELLNKILDGAGYSEVESYVNSQRGKLIRQIKNPVYLGVAKQINNLDEKYAEWKRTEKIGKGKVALPGHVRAAVNYNEMVLHFNTGDALLRSGDKGIIFYLLPNEFGIKTIAFPADITVFPKWFTDNFKIDRKITESKMIDSKIESTFNTMDWEIPTPQKSSVKKLLSF